MDTNLAENAIRPFALGRRNWLFADLTNLFAKLPLAKTVEDIEELLPFGQKSES